MHPEILSPQQLDDLLTCYAHSRPEGTPDDTPLMRLLATIDRDQLSQIMTEQRCQPGEVICWEGDSGDAMYLIRSGRVLVFKDNLDAPTIIGERGPGEILGEMALLEGQPRSATAVAVDETRLLRIAREGFHTWLSSSPAVGMSIMATLSARLRTSDSVRTATERDERHLVQQVSRLQGEKEQLLDLQRLRQETSDLIVHDLRNPLGVISGVLNMLDMLLPEDVVQDNRELLELASSACERMRRLVDSLLDVARFESGEMSLALADVSIGALLMENARRESVLAARRGITLDVVLADDLPTLTADVEKLDRVLANLLDNALKYSPDGGRITLAADAGPEAVVVRVIDEGPGIPADQRERIFERFAQVTGTDRPRRPGFGLGLTFCKLAVEAHGGRIWVEPGPGERGSCFAFALPHASAFDSQ